MELISPHAVVKTQHIGNNVTIGEFAVIRDGVEIGDNVVIHPHVVIESGVTIGDNVEIFPGAYLGKVPKGAGVLTRPPVYKPSIKIGRDCSIGPHAVLFYDVELADKVLLGDGASIREGTRVGSRSVIGRYVTVNYNTELFAKQVAPQVRDLFDDRWENAWWPKPLADDERAAVAGVPQ